MSNSRSLSISPTNCNVTFIGSVAPSDNWFKISAIYKVTNLKVGSSLSITATDTSVLMFGTKGDINYT